MALRPETKLALGHAALDRGQTLSEVADQILDLALTQWVHLPILGRVGCGNAVIADEYVDERIWLPAAIAGVADFGLYAKGDSMAPLIDEGDLLLVKLQETADPGQVVVVRNEENEAIVKRLAKRNGQVELHSENPAYKPICKPAGVIVGRVISVTRNL